MAREKIGILEDIVFDHLENTVGCARAKKPNGREFYAGFGDVIQVEEDTVVLVEDPLRTGGLNFEVVKVPRELMVNNPRLRKLLI